MAPKRKLGELLIAAGLIDEFELNAALADQANWGAPLGKTLVSLGYVSEEEMLAVLGEQLGLPIAQLRDREIEASVLERVPHEIAKKHHCIPLFVRNLDKRGELHLGMSDPTDLGALDEISFRTGLKVYPVLVLHDQLDQAIARHYLGIDHDRHGVEATALGRRPSDAERESEPSDTPPAVATSPVRAADATRGDHKGASAPVVLRALIQILLDRGLIEREELARAIRES